MSRRAVLALVLGAGAVSLFLLPLPATTPGPDARSRAESLYQDALDAIARLAEAETRRLLVAAFEADPGYLAPILEAVRTTDVGSARSPMGEFLALIDRVVDPGERSCLRRYLDQNMGLSASRVPPPEGEPMGPCQAIAASDLSALRRFWRPRPGQALHATELVNHALARDPGSAIALADSLLAEGLHPVHEAHVLALRISALHQAGRHEEAHSAEASAERRMARAPPGVRLRYLMGLLDHRGIAPRQGQAPDVAEHNREVAESVWPEAMELVSGRDRYIWRLHWLGIWALELLDRGSLRESVAVWNRLEAMAGGAGDGPALAQILVRRGRAYVKLGRFPEAERDLLRGRNQARLLGRGYWELEAQHNLLHLYEGQGRDEEALAAGEAFVKVAWGPGPSPQRMISNHDVAWYLQRRGRPEEARPYFEAMVATIDSMGLYDYFAGEYFEAIGDLDRALLYYNRVTPEQAEIDRATAALTRMSEALGDTSATVRYARRHDDWAFHNYPESTPLLPGVLARLGRTGEARSALEEARDRARRQGQVAGWASLSLDLAELEVGSGRFARAAALADSARDAARTAGLLDRAVRAGSVGAYARLRSSANGAKASGLLEDLEHSVREAVRMGLPSLEGDLRYRLADALIRAGRVSDGLEELAAAADLAGSLAASLTPDPARAGYRAQRIHISNRALEAILAGPFGPGERVRRFAGWTVLRKDPEAVAESRVPSLDGIRTALEEDQALLDYVVLDSVTAVLVVTGEEAVIRRLPAHPDALGRRIATLRDHMAPRVGSYVDLTRARFDMELAAALYRDLVEPLLPDLGERSRLLVVPDGPLHLLPFDALVRPIDGSFLIESHEVTLRPALGPPSALPAGAVEAGVALLAPGGETLPGPPGVADEIDEVRKALGPRVHVLRGARATEDRFRAAAAVSGVLHLAAHGYPNDREPAFARLALVPAGDDDGSLHAHEIGALDLPGSLVVLSACDTGVGRLLAGEGVLSLGRAFLRAGASATVASLWPVGASTAELMGAFYRDLGSGASPSEALRAAKLSLLAGDLAEPFHWAPFVLVAGER